MHDVADNDGSDPGAVRQAVGLFHEPDESQGPLLLSWVLWLVVSWGGQVSLVATLS